MYAAHPNATLSPEWKEIRALKILMIEQFDALKAFILENPKADRQANEEELDCAMEVLEAAFLKIENSLFLRVEGAADRREDKTLAAINREGEQTRVAHKDDMKELEASLAEKSSTAQEDARKLIELVHTNDKLVRSNDDLSRTVLKLVEANKELSASNAKLVRTNKELSQSHARMVEEVEALRLQHHHEAASQDRKEETLSHLTELISGQQRRDEEGQRLSRLGEATWVATQRILTRIDHLEVKIQQDSAQRAALEQ